MAHQASRHPAPKVKEFELQPGEEAREEEETDYEMPNDTDEEMEQIRVPRHRSRSKVVSQFQKDPAEQIPVRRSDRERKKKRAFDSDNDDNASRRGRSRPRKMKQAENQVPKRRKGRLRGRSRGRSRKRSPPRNWVQLRWDEDEYEDDGPIHDTIIVKNMGLQPNAPHPPVEDPHAPEPPVEPEPERLSSPIREPGLSNEPGSTLELSPLPVTECSLSSACELSVEPSPAPEPPGSSSLAAERSPSLAREELPVESSPFSEQSSLSMAQRSPSLAREEVPVARSAAPLQPLTSAGKRLCEVAILPANTLKRGRLALKGKGKRCGSKTGPKLHAISPTFLDPLLVERMPRSDPPAMRGKIWRLVSGGRILDERALRVGSISITPPPVELEPQTGSKRRKRSAARRAEKGIMNDGAVPEDSGLGTNSSWEESLEGLQSVRGRKEALQPEPEPGLEPVAMRIGKSERAERAPLEPVVELNIAPEARMDNNAVLVDNFSSLDWDHRSPYAPSASPLSEANFGSPSAPSVSSLSEFSLGPSSAPPTPAPNSISNTSFPPRAGQCSSPRQPSAATYPNLSPDHRRSIMCWKNRKRARFSQWSGKDGHHRRVFELFNRLQETEKEQQEARAKWLAVLKPSTG
jgi:hypothetical protein